MLGSLPLNEFISTVEDDVPWPKTIGFRPQDYLCIECPLPAMHSIEGVFPNRVGGGAEGGQITAISTGITRIKPQAAYPHSARTI